MGPPRSSSLACEGPARPSLAKSLHRGLTEQQIKLGCVVPGENAATFGDALRRLTDQAHHLNLDGQRYWYSTQPTVTRLATDRASQYSDEDEERFNRYFDPNQNPERRREVKKQTRILDREFQGENLVPNLCSASNLLD